MRAAEYHAPMSKVEILEELPRLTTEERKEILLKLAELDGDSWLDTDEPLTDAEKAVLDARLAENDPDAGSSWAEVEARIRARL